MTIAQAVRRNWRPTLGGAAIGAGLGAATAAPFAFDPDVGKKRRWKIMAGGTLAGAGLGAGIGARAGVASRAQKFRDAKADKKWTDARRAESQRRQQRQRASEARWEEHRQDAKRRAEEWQRQKARWSQENAEWEQKHRAREKKYEEARSKYHGGSSSQAGQSGGGRGHGPGSSQRPGFGQGAAGSVWDRVPRDVHNKLRGVARHAKDAGNTPQARANARVIFEKLHKKHDLQGSVDELIKNASAFRAGALAQMSFLSHK